MAATEAMSYGNTNGGTLVTVVAAPTAGTRRIVAAGTIYNDDTVASTVTLRINKVADSSKYIICKITLQPGESLNVEKDDIIVLNSTESLEVILASAKTTNDCQYRFSYLDAS